MPAKNLGKMEQVDLRQVWEDEARDFTPWLASEEGLALLGDTIGRELELVKREASVGPFNADVLARDANEEEHFVVVENQLGKTNHDHLGKLIAYASGLNARTVVWIAESFTDEHRQAIDWLNENMGNAVAFYALQIELWRIGTSPPAPQFRVVSSPNPYESTIRGRISEELSETKQDYLRFWEDLREYFQSKKTFLQLRKPRPQHWYTIALGRSRFNLSLTISSRMKRTGCEVYISGSNAKQAFEMLRAQQNEIEKDLGVGLEWQPLEEKEACRIVLYRNGDIYDTQQRQELKEWFLKTAEQFHKVFSPRVRALQLPRETEESE
jgi:hypothetical protein